MLLHKRKQVTGTAELWYVRGKPMSEHEEKKKKEEKCDILQYMRLKRILSWSFYSNSVALEAFAGVKVEDEEHVCPVKHNDLVPFMLGADKGLEGEEKKKEK